MWRIIYIWFWFERRENFIWWQCSWCKLRSVDVYIQHCHKKWYEIVNRLKTMIIEWNSLLFNNWCDKVNISCPYFEDLYIRWPSELKFNNFRLICQRHWKCDKINFPCPNNIKIVHVKIGIGCFITGILIDPNYEKYLLIWWRLPNSYNNWCDKVNMSCPYFEDL